VVGRYALYGKIAAGAPGKAWQEAAAGRSSFRTLTEDAMIHRTFEALAVAAVLTGCGIDDPRPDGCDGSYVSLEAAFDDQSHASYETQGDCTDADCSYYNGAICFTYFKPGGTCSITASSEAVSGPCTVRVEDPGCSHFVRLTLGLVPPTNVMRLKCLTEVEPLKDCGKAPCP
jgi:hypothetical protein